jgi:hypothetical protein
LCPEEKEGKKEHTIQEREKLLVIRNFTGFVFVLFIYILRFDFAYHYMYEEIERPITFYIRQSKIQSVHLLNVFFFCLLVLSLSVLGYRSQSEAFSVSLCKQILIKLVTFGENLTLSWTIRFDFVSMSIGENFVIEIDGTLL